jgi:hypothetical protein
MWRTFQQVVVVLALGVLSGAADARGSRKIPAKDAVRVPYMESARTSGKKRGEAEPTAGSSGYRGKGDR